MVGFIFGGDTGETPESLKRKREIARALLTAQRAPRNVGEGLNSLGDGIVAAVLNHRADSAEQQGMASAQEAFSPILASLGFGEFPAAPAASGGASVASSAPSDPNVGSTIDFARGSQGNPAYRDAIASIESAGSGDYAAVGPTHPKLGRALGRYQVMEANIGPWSKKHLGREVTPDEFLADPKLQDAIFDAEFGSYVQKYGPEGAAQAWFGGEGGVGKLGRQDSLGTSIGEYGQKFARAIGPQVASLDPAAGLPPEQPGIPAQTAAQPANPQVAQALTQPQAGGREEMAGNSNNPSLGLLLGASSNQWLNPSQRGIIEALTGQRIKEMDPMTGLERRKMELELRNLENPPSDFGFMELPDGTVIRTDPRTGQAAEAFKGQPKPEAKPSAVQEYEYAKEQGFPGTFQDWEASKKGGMSLQVDPETGAVTFQQGANIKPMTEGQSKDTVFATRAEGALPLIDKFGDALTSLPESVAGQAPLIGNYMKTPEFQQAEQAGKEFLQAILRKDTGAAITAEETSEYGSVYLPRPGDSPEVLAQKKTSRIRALEAIKAGMPPQAILAQEKALMESGSQADDDGSVPEGVDPELWKFMTPEERALWN